MNKPLKTVFKKAQKKKMIITIKYNLKIIVQKLKL